ncbi:MAG: hypothetical protein HON43_07995 [Alphaproteobacteria bacterium]|jgi:hypothetical protein|nr:hypothetical protein [Alphaproteobacteria bacterium]MBT5390707.1 hypothetical protein [Alphaproteobacteria bacterium]
MRILKLFVLVLIVLDISVAVANYSRTLTYDDVRREGGFTSTTLKDVSTIIRSGEKLTDNEKTQIINSKCLIKVHTLDLSDQGIDDNFMWEISNSSSLERLINLDLSGNKDITNASIKVLLGSDEIGKVRDLPQISGKYGIPAISLHVNGINTGIIPEDKASCFTKERFHFHVEYLHPVSSAKIAEPTSNAVKFVECTLF